ncbi:MAG: hypothetical protein V3U92_19700 [Cellulophaga sp.]
MKEYRIRCKNCGLLKWVLIGDLEKIKEMIECQDCKGVPKGQVKSNG